MKTTLLFRRGLAFWQLLAALTLTGGAAFAAPTIFNSFNIDSDIPGVAHDTDPLLINPWGLTTGVEGNLHVNDDGSGVENPLRAPGRPADRHVRNELHALDHDPTVGGDTGTLGSPTGIDANFLAILSSSTTDDFPITSGTGTGSSRYLFCTEDGAIAGYRDDVNLDSAIIGPTMRTSPPKGQVTPGSPSRGCPQAAPPRSLTSSTRRTSPKRRSTCSTTASSS